MDRNNPEESTSKRRKVMSDSDETGGALAEKSIEESIQYNLTLMIILQHRSSSEGYDDGIGSITLAHDDAVMGPKHGGDQKEFIKFIKNLDKATTRGTFYSQMKKYIDVFRLSTRPKQWPEEKKKKYIKVESHGNSHAVVGLCGDVSKLKVALKSKIGEIEDINEFVSVIKNEETGLENCVFEQTKEFKRNISFVVSNNDQNCRVVKIAEKEMKVVKEPFYAVGIEADKATELVKREKWFNSPTELCDGDELKDRLEQIMKAAYDGEATYQKEKKPDEQTHALTLSYHYITFFADGRTPVEEFVGKD